MENTKCKILLIEDDKLDQMAFERLVRDENLSYDYTIAGSAAQARSILGSERFDVVIVDYFLGDGTAFDIWELVVGTPAILATGVGDEELAVKAMKAGAYDYLIKDSDRNYLKILPQTIKNAIRRKKAEQELKKYHDNLEVLVKTRTEQLAEEKELLFVTLSGMGDGLIAVDAEKRITVFNRVAEDLTGGKLEEAQGKKVDEVFQIINEQTKETIKSPIDRVLNSGKIENIVDRGVVLIAKDGSEHPISATTASIYKNDGILAGVVMVLHDVSKEHEIDRMKADFVSSVSHELRTPLHNILSFSSFGVKEYATSKPEELLDYFYRIQQSGRTLLTLVNDLLDLSKLESGRVAFELQPVDLGALIASVTEEFASLVSEKDLIIHYDTSSFAEQAMVDTNKIKQVLRNLLSNAVAFSPEGGIIKVDICRMDSSVVVSVSDQGPGIPGNELEMVFDKFVQSSRAKSGAGGIGLGLAICSEIIGAHKGRIWAQNNPDAGAVFSFEIPISLETNVVAEPVLNGASIGLEVS